MNRLCRHHLSIPSAESASPAVKPPTKRQFAVGTALASKPRTKGALMSHRPARKWSHSPASAQKPVSKCAQSASAVPTKAAFAVAVWLSAYPASHGETASHSPRAKLPQSCHFVVVPMSNSLTRAARAFQHLTGQLLRLFGTRAVAAL